MRTSPPFILASIILTVGLADVAAVHAGCNIIPVAGQTFPSAESGVRSGSVSSPIAAPLETVKVSVNPGCDGLPSNFAFDAMTDVVKLTFVSPAPGNPVTIVNGENVALDSEDSTGRTITFTIPDTTNTGSPDGLAGPARITVERGVQVLARISELFQPASGCDLAEENVFGHFIVLPKPNDVFLQSTMPSRMLLTVDYYGNILVPLDHTGGTVLPEGPGAPVARFLTANSAYPAAEGGLVGLSDALAAALNHPMTPVTSEELMRSFTIDGRPLPPLLRIDDSGNLFGTTDADRSVLRVRRLDGAGNPIYDVTTRLSNDGVMGPDVGPIVINPAFTLTQCDPVPLRGLRSSTRVAAFVRDEFDEAPLINLNPASGDLDMTDSVVHIIGTAAGGQDCAINTGEAVSELAMPGFMEPVLETSNDLVAFAVSEEHQDGDDIDGNGNFGVDHILRVYDATGAALTATNVAVDLSQRVNDRTLVISDPLVFARSQPGNLAPLASVPTSGDPFFMAISPDGKSLYAGTHGNNSIDVFSRNLTTGVLTFVETEGPVNGPPRAIAVHPSGTHVYVIPQSTSTQIVDFSRNTATGELTFVQDWNDPPAPPPLPTAESLTVSPDGAHLYFADFGASRIRGFRLDPDGALTFSHIIPYAVDGQNGVDGIDGVTSVAISPDGKFVYATGFNEDAIAVFSRDIESGILTFVEAKFDGIDGLIGMAGPAEVTVSPDGKNVYVSGTFFDALVVFTRNQATGTLTYVQTADGGAGEYLTVSPDGRNVYVARPAGGAINVFGRNGANGTVGFVETAVLTSPDSQNVLVSPDGLHFYGADFTGDEIQLFGVSQGKLTVFDTETNSYRPEAEAEATEVVVSGRRAGILTPEGNVGGSLNSDTDIDDLVAQAYDGSAFAVGDLKSLGVAANRIVISADVVAVTVPEAKQNEAPGGAAGNDLNDDGDALDEVVFRHPLPVPSPAIPQNLGVAADTLGVTGATLVIVTPENAEGPDGIDCLATTPAGGCDLDGDGDNLDRVLRFHQAALPAPGFIEVRRPVEELVIGDTLVAFRSSEAAMNAKGPGCLPTSPVDGCDRNGDGDTLDAEMMIYDLTARTLIATGQSAIPCSHTIPGCDARQPYKIKGDNVCFLTSEIEQNNPPKDLDGDTETDGIVLQCYNTRSRRLQRFPLCDTTSTVEVFPEDFVDNTQLNVRVSETALGRDVNGDMVLDDCVLFIVGDQDGDDSYDGGDSCIDILNANQVDSDLDGLGDICDPNAFCGDFVPPAPPTSPGAATTCQQTIGKAATGYLKQRASATRTCLDAVAKGKLVGDATALCHGTVDADGEVPPSEPKTALKIAKAAAKFSKAVAKKCSDPQVALLEACGPATGDLDTCVVPAYASTADAASGLAYGSVTAIGDKATLKCQRTVGNESRNYLAKVTQAMQQCLDKVNAGTLVGDPQLLCLGSLTPAGIVLPTEAMTLTKVQKAEVKMREKIVKDCPTTQLQSLEVCGGVATTTTSAGNCLACTHWRRSVESLKSAYGPLP
jgi:6-phosphogluconolactonase (cycloisomerase 2 family)